MQTSDKRLYMGIEHGERRVKSVKDIYEAKKIRLACNMACQDSE